MLPSHPVQLYDPASSVDSNFAKTLLPYRDTDFDIIVNTGHEGQTETIRISGRYLIFNLFFWQPLLRRGMPIIKERHLFLDEDLTAGVLTRIHTNILWDMIMHRPLDVQDLKFEFIRTVEGIYNFTIGSLNRYVYTTDIFSIADTLTTPEAKQVIRIDPEKIENRGIKFAEGYFKERYQEVNKYFTRKDVNPNVFRAPLQLGLLNPTQFPQLVCGVGPRTDVDESLVKLPIMNSFIDGLEDIRAYAVESLAAKKSVHYNAEEMPFTQYTNRKQQLNSSAITRIYTGDCGTDVTVKFRIHKSTAKNVLGKNILHNGQVIPLLDHNIAQFYDTDVEMFSVMACRHTNGFCHKCGGMLAQYFLPPTVIPGIIAGSEVMSPLAQQVLSNKHMATTFSTLYELPEELRSWLINVDNDIYFRDDAPTTYLKIGVPYALVKKLSYLSSVEGEIKDDRYFSQINEMLVMNSETGEIIMPRVEMIDKYKTVPYFTAEFLDILRNNPKDIETNEDGTIVWISLRHLDHKTPFLRAVVFNYSTKIFVGKIQNIFTSQIADFTSITQYLETITNAIWTRISPNILHLEIMGKASMITSPANYDVPVVTDPNLVMFGRLEQIIPRRSIGTQIGFEQFFMWISNPVTYLTPKPEGPFDILLGYSD